MAVHMVLMQLSIYLSQLINYMGFSVIVLVKPFVAIKQIVDAIVPCEQSFKTNFPSTQKDIVAVQTPPYGYLIASDKMHWVPLTTSSLTTSTQL